MSTDATVKGAEIKKSLASQLQFLGFPSIPKQTKNGKEDYKQRSSKKRNDIEKRNVDIVETQTTLLYDLAKGMTNKPQADRIVKINLEIWADRALIFKIFLRRLRSVQTPM